MNRPQAPHAEFDTVLKKCFTILSEQALRDEDELLYQQMQEALIEFDTKVQQGFSRPGSI